MSFIDTLTDTRDRLDQAIADAWENRRREIAVNRTLVRLTTAGSPATIGHDNDESLVCKPLRG